MDKELSNLFTDAIDWLCEVLGIKKEEYLEKENQNKIVE